jgi:hypothetical protein
MDNKLKLAQLRICVEKHVYQHANKLNNLKNISTSEEQYYKLKAAFLSGFNWKPDSIIKIGFIGDGSYVPRKTYDELSKELDLEGKKLKIDPLQKIVDNMSVIDGIKKIVNDRIQPIVGLKLLFVEDYKNADVRISFDIYDGAWCLIGTQCLDPENDDKATMNLGWFDVATTLHEFGHMLSLIHEHQNSNKNPIEWNKEEVYKWAKITQNWDKETTDENILKTYPIDQINGSVFDPLSIMLYFYPPNLTTNNRGTRENLTLSGQDVKYISEKYPGGSMSPEEYYMTIYNQTLQENLNESNVDLYSIYPMNSNILFYVSVSVSIIVLLLIAFYMIYKRN